MSLMKTLAKVAIGVAVAKGVGSMVQASRQGGGTARAGTGGLLGGASRTGSAPGGLQDIMRDVLAGTPAGASRTTRPKGGTAPDGLGGLLDQLAGGRSGAGGGLDDLLGSLTKGGALGGLLGGLAGVAGGAAAGRTAPADDGAGFGEKLNQSLRNFGEPDTPPAPQHEAAAALMLRAMIQAAKADGKVDEGERAKLLDTLQDATKAEMAFVKAELAAPVDIEGLAAQVPDRLRAQVYAMSIMAITLDNRSEAQYLHEFATALGLDHATVNHIHAELGVPSLYT
jgi:uncharacterized membrane protein YebE (DUF533 family)